MPEDHKDYGDLIEKHKGWIFKRNSEIAAALEKAQKKKLDLTRTDEELKKLISSIVEDISSDLKVNINNIYFRRMKSKWGAAVLIRILQLIRF
ncbi:MAG: M48 family peptidase [Candidatus Methanoperedens sp.]|nr:MAG: M48 family peptidase [Candidatus Methanoperedens sp.]